MILVINVEDGNMKVFISWSGEASQKYAGAIKEWLEQCIQSLEVFYSSEDIEKGDNWQVKLSNELKDTNYGIICLTSDNIDAPWIHFEAGALSKMLDSRVMVLAVNISFADIKGPLKTFQATKLEKDDAFRMLKAINNGQDKPLSEEKLKNSFDAFWPQFNEKIETIKTEIVVVAEDKEPSSEVNVGDTVDEILQLVRNLNTVIGSPEKILPADYLEYVLRKLDLFGRNEEKVYSEIYEFTKYILNRYHDLFSDDSDIDSFFDNYQKMISRRCYNKPTWKRRFYMLFSQRERIDDRLNDEL